MSQETFERIDAGGEPSKEEIYNQFIEVIKNFKLPPDEIFAYVFLKNKRAYFMTLPAPGAELRTDLGARLRKLHVMNIEMTKFGRPGEVARVHYYEEY